MIPGSAAAAASHCSNTGIVYTLAAIIRTSDAFSGSVFAVSGFAYDTVGRILTVGAVRRAIFNLSSARACVQA